MNRSSQPTVASNQRMHNAGSLGGELVNASWILIAANPRRSHRITGLAPLLANGNRLYIVASQFVEVQGWEIVTHENF